MSKIKLNSTAGGSVSLGVDPALATDEEVLVPSGGFLGDGQTWQDVTASRTLGVLYTNSTGRPIQVCVSTRVNSEASVSFLIDGIETLTATASGGTTASQLDASRVIPNGSTYNYSIVSGTVTGTVWSELR